MRTLAVRGDRLQPCSGAAGLTTPGTRRTYLHVFEIGDDGRSTTTGRFDEDDFEGAYRELERRYYAGEGAAFAEAGTVQVEWIAALNRGDLDRVGDLYGPGMRVENRSRTGFPDRSASDLRTSFTELNAMVASTRTWPSSVCWVSPAWNVTRLERKGVGADGEQYEWTRVLVNEIRGGLLLFSCEFELEDEEAAFAYAEERAASSRLAVTNPSWESSRALNSALNAHDLDGVMGCWSDRFVYDDHRTLSGDPVYGKADLRTAFGRILQQFTTFEGRILAVRGDRLNLAWSRWSDDAGNESPYLHVFEIDDEGRITYDGRFDEDDFEGAYRELERRYYAGEGAAFAAMGSVQTDFVIAMNRGDFDRIFDELVLPDLQVENRSLSAVQGSSATDLRAATEQLHAMVASVRVWNSAVCWLSPTWLVARHEREAIGQDGERYAWTSLLVGESRDGRLASLCVFDIDNEERAFADAEERMRAASSRLAVTNRASELAHSLLRAVEARDADAAAEVYADQFVYEDRRRLSGDPIVDHAGMRAAVERIYEQFSVFDGRTLAVRGERLALVWSRWSDDSGNETTSLHVFEVGDDGRTTYNGRFDEDDFEGAYRELERRYYADEGAPFAEAGTVGTDWMTALNRGDFDAVFGELTAPELRVEDQSRSSFPDRSAAALRASMEELNAMVASARTWPSAIRWLSPNWCATRTEREALGRDGEEYSWERITVSEFRDDRLASLCDFDIDNEERAFAYAEERMRATDDSN